MDKNFIGRTKEIQQLDDICASNKAEFVAVYGRRRVGKTYLIQQYFDNCFLFSVSGIIEGNMAEEMFAFTSALEDAGYEGSKPKTWLEAFRALGQTLDARLADLRKGMRSHRRVVIYMDELPCFDTPRSGFVRALGHFWNTWAALHKDIIMIVCGSATSWMIDNIINAKGGLHDRITGSIYLRQFTLLETEAYLNTIGIHWSRQTIVETYMIMGGIPFYLSLLRHRENLAQNIDRLYFSKNSELSKEYRRLYASLYKKPEMYMRIVETLAKSRQGMTRNEIAEKLKVQSSGLLTKQFENLCSCDIIRQYVTKVNGKMKQKDAYYQVSDLFTRFHLTFSQKLQSEDYWEQRLNTPVLNTWQGLAFEHVCMAHIQQIRHALGLDRIAVEYYSWRGGNPIRQIDMIIERADHQVHLCEMKFSLSKYAITASDDEKMRERAQQFTWQTGSTCGIIPTWITSFGLADGKYSVNINNSLTLEDLFA